MNVHIVDQPSAGTSAHAENDSCDDDLPLPVKVSWDSHSLTSNISTGTHVVQEKSHDVPVVDPFDGRLCAPLRNLLRKNKNNPARHDNTPVV